MPKQEGSVFRVRPRDVRAGGAKLQGGRRQRQPQREVQAGAGRDGAPGDGGRRQRQVRGSDVSNTPSAAVRDVVASLGLTRFGPAAVEFLLRWYEENTPFFILPAQYKDKRPSIDWHEYEDAPNRPPHTWTLAKWFKGVHLNECNFAVLCGKPSGGLVCIDFDDEELAREHPLNTLTVSTGKGIHYYVCVGDAEIRNRSFFKSHGVRLDLRGQGGIAIIPPSVHPTGRVYRFEKMVDVADITEAQLDAYLEAVLGERVITESAPNEPGWFEDAIGATCLEGGRNDTATRIAGRLLRTRLSQTEVIALLQLWNEARCQPPMPVREILVAVRSLLRKQSEEERRVQPAAEPEPDQELEPGSIFTEAALADSQGSGETGGLLEDDGDSQPS